MIRTCKSGWRRGARLSAMFAGCWVSLSLLSCSGDEATSLEDRECTRDGRCLPGYACSVDHICVAIDSDTADEPEPSSPSGGLQTRVGGAMTAEDAGVKPLGGRSGGAGAGTASGAAGKAAAGVTGSAVQGGAAGAAGAGAGRGAEAGRAAAGRGPAAGSGGAAGQPAAAGSPAAECGEQSLCNGECVDYESDAKNCGDCNAVCQPPEGASATCVEAQCRFDCGDEAMNVCGERCVDTERSANNCGSCGNSCAEGQRCEGGRCEDRSDSEGSGMGGGINVAELEKLLGRFGITLEQLSRGIGVEPSELEGMHITLRDLQRIGLTYERMAELGITLEDLERIGIDLEGAGRP
jgi:hypothetical protein